jgi:type IV pilus assembly protein PilW
MEYWSDGVMGENVLCESLPASGGARGDKGLPAGRMAGFTLIELLVAIALGMVILAGLFRTFKVQHDSYVIQDQVSAMQQNLRAAMYLITRDLQMAGYYTNFDRNNRQMDWNDLDGDNNPNNNTETGRPSTFAVNDISSGFGIQAGTDVITIVKADYDPEDPKCGPTSIVCRSLGSIGGIASDGAISLGSWDLGGSNFGLLVKQDLSSADLIQKDGGGWKPVGSLMESYDSHDSVFRTDIIIYRIRADAAHPCLERKNLGRGETTYQVIAENIENLQFRYQLNDGTWTIDPGVPPAMNHNVKAIEVFLIGRTAYPQRGYIDTSTYTFGSGATAYSYTPPSNDRTYRRKVLTSLVKTRNVGL